MTLGDLLDELRNNVLRDRSDIIAGDTDSLWSDETLLRYIGDAERRFARQSLIIRDATTPQVTQVVLKNGVVTYPLHRSVLSVLSAKYSTNTFDMQRTGHALLLQSTPPEFLSFDPADPFNYPPGPPIAFYTDETTVYATKQRVTMSVYPTPGPDQDGQIVYMRVARLPLTSYANTLDNLNCESDLPEDYQLDVLEWAAYRAQRTFDGDAGAPTSAEQHKKRFEEAVAEAQAEVKRKIFTNIGIHYGMNGFSWVR